MSLVFLLTGAVIWTGGQGSVYLNTASGGWTTNILSTMWPLVTTLGEKLFFFFKQTGTDECIRLNKELLKFLSFRFAKYYKAADGEETRTLIKAYGIRFDVIVFGTVRPD